MAISRECFQRWKTYLTNAYTAILHESFIAGAYKRTKGVCTGGVVWTSSIDLTFIYICGQLRMNTYGGYGTCHKKLYEIRQIPRNRMYHIIEEMFQRWNIISYQCTHCRSSQILHCRCIQKSQRCLHRWSVPDMIRWSDIHLRLQN